jgi:opacity protein-like surface antigen
MESGSAAWSCAVTPAELAEVLHHDLARQAHDGLGDIGLPNAEGRIAWSLAYTLSVLVHLDSRHAPRLTAAADFSTRRQHLSEALSLVARQGSATPEGHAARRYSLDRSPLLFALHLGRIAHLLAAGQAAGFGSSEVSAALADLHWQLVVLGGTAEGPLQQGPYQTLGYRRGIAFWADGANVPYNYVSGYVLGLLASAPQPVDQAARASALLEPLRALENLDTQAVWHYWWGLGRSGWTESDGVSDNTPAYAGQGGLAHITYRSMDAMAVLRLAAVAPSAVDPKTIDNLGTLVAAGQLLPFVNQELVRMGRAVALRPAVARRLSRSATAWETQGQVFALEALAAR